MAINRRRVNAIIEFIENLRAPDGDLVGEEIQLRPWQKEFILEVYGPSRPDGSRLVRQACLSMGRKNGKTLLVASLCLVHLYGPESVANGQLYSLSIDREQAGILFNYAKNMIYLDETLSAELNVIESRKTIFDTRSGSTYYVLSGEKKGKMGKSSSFIAFDELAEFGADRTLYDALMTSTGAHSNPMVWVFSTQAAGTQAVLSELLDYGEKIKRGEIEDPTFASRLYAVPEEADIWDEESWYLANPALGDFRSLDEMRNFAEKAKQMPSAEATFRNLYLNQRIDSTRHFISPSAWQANGGAPDSDAFHSFPVYGGLDLSGKNDLSSLELVCQDDEKNIHVKSYFWVPAHGLREKEKRDGAQYCLWRDQGYLEAKPGKTVDYAWVAHKIADLHAEHFITSIRFDRWRIDDLKREMDEIGLDCWIEGKETSISGGICLVPHGQGYKDMTPAVERLEDALSEARVRHGKHPVLTMCAANTVVTTDPAGSRKFAKDKSTGRIDGIVALAMALTALESGTEKPFRSKYEDGASVIAF